MIEIAILILSPSVIVSGCMIISGSNHNTTGKIIGIGLVIFGLTATTLGIISLSLGGGG